MRRQKLQLPPGQEGREESSKEAALRAAAVAALRAIPAGARTVFLDPDGPQPQEQANASGDGEQSAAAAGPDSNPLASLLGHYSDDEEEAGGGDERTGGELGAAAPSDAAPAAASTSTGSDAAVPQQAADAQASGGGKPALVAELASFMEELHSSGLLNDGAAPADDSSSQEQQHQQSGPASSPGAQETQQQEERKGSDQQQQDEAERAGPAEQRTLGALADAPEWCKVLDTGSGKIYFWNISTNEVVWDAPPGTDGEKLLPAPSTIDGAAAATDAERSGGGVGGADATASAAGGGDQGAPPQPEAAADGVSATLQLPSESVAPTLESLRAELRAAAQPLLAAAPAALRMLIQLEVLQQQWDVFSAQQRTAAAAGDAAGALGWDSYEQSVLRQLDGMSKKVQPALQQLREKQRRQEEAAAATAEQQPKQQQQPKQTPSAAGGPKGASNGPAQPPPPPRPEAWHGHAGHWDSWGPHGHYDPAAFDPSFDPAAAHGYFPGDGFDYAAYAGYVDHMGAPPLPPNAGPGAFGAPGHYSSQPLMHAGPAPPPAEGGTYEGLPGLGPEAPPLPPDGSQEQQQQQPAAAGSRKRDRAAAAPTLGGGGAKRGRAAALMDKWSAVRRDLEKEEEDARLREEALSDPVEREKARVRDIEEWRREQLRSGAASSNPNFAPLGGGGSGGAGPAAAAEPAAKRQAQPASKKARAAAKDSGGSSSGAGGRAAAKGAGAAAANGVAEKPDLAALSNGLPAGWRAMWDKGSGSVYYGNPDTKETSWTRP